MNIAHEISMKNIDKQKVAFTFFNNEEWGLLGSIAMKKYWNKINISFDNKRIINFDCVGNGDTILITHGEGKEFAKEIQEKFRLYTIYSVDRFRYKVIPLSDDFTFRKKDGIGVIFCKKSKLFKGHFIPNIHSSKDIVLNLENIELCSKIACNLLYSENKKEILSR